jgi:hypothetical protein
MYFASIICLHYLAQSCVCFSVYPASVQCKDFRDRFPIEIAVAHRCSNKIIDYLFCAYPEAVLGRWRDEGQETNLSRLDCRLLQHEVIRSHIRLIIQDMSGNKHSAMGRSESSKQRQMSNTQDSFLTSGAYDFGLLLEQVPNKKRQVQYDSNECTLYKLIETQDWPRVDKFLLSEDITKQVSTWVYRQSKKSSWSILPLHAAVAARAPYLTIGRLIERESIHLFPVPYCHLCLNPKIVVNLTHDHVRFVFFPRLSWLCAMS